jgi:hypothetical protein
MENEAAKKLREISEYEKEQLRQVKMTLMDGTETTVYEEARKFWLSPNGKAAIKRAKDNNWQ